MKTKKRILFIDIDPEDFDKKYSKYIVISSMDSLGAVHYILKFKNGTGLNVTFLKPKQGVISKLKFENEYLFVEDNEDKGFGSIAALDRIIEEYLSYDSSLAPRNI